MLAKLLDAGPATNSYDPGPWQNGEQRWLFQIEVFGNRPTTDNGMPTAQVPHYVKQNRTSQHASIAGRSLGRVPINAYSEHATTIEAVDNFLRFFGADH